MLTVSRSLTMCALIGALIPAMAAPAAAQQAPAEAAENPVLTFFRNTEVTGFVDAYYTYNWNAPKTACATVGGVAIFNCLHLFDVAHNAFSLNLAELALEKKPTRDSRGGFRIDLDYGATAGLVAGFDPGGTTLYQNIQQAYVSFLAPISTGTLQLDFGKFVTPAGFEVIETKDNWNYSRGLVFALAMPAYHMGMRAAYSRGDTFTLTASLVNGWNNVVDNNGGKTVIVSVTGKPSPMFVVTENYIGGPERNGNNGDWRHLSDTILTITASPRLSVALNYDYGHELTSRWQGVAAYLKYQVNPWLAVLPRYEYYNDRDGWSTGAAQNLHELTLTTELKHKDGVVMKVEYRTDLSNTAYFTKNTSEMVRHQSVLTVGWIYAFSSKAP